MSIRTLYRIECDGCDLEGPVGSDPHMTLLSARDQGWILEPTHRCPECRERVKETVRVIA